MRLRRWIGVARARTLRMPATGMFGSTTARARGFAYILDKAKRTTTLVEKIRTDGASPGRLAHLEALCSQMRDPCKVVRDLAGFESSWRSELRGLADAIAAGPDGLRQAREVAVRAESAAKNDFTQRRAARNHSFWAWVDEHLRKRRRRPPQVDEARRPRPAVACCHSGRAQSLPAGSRRC